MKISIILTVTFASCALVGWGQTVRLDNSSDWWSINRKDPGRPAIKSSTRELSGSNFEIAGVTLGHGGFEAITAKLGNATVVERGDASTGRSQVCYISSPDGAVHLVFEFGEDESVLYLFLEKKPWNGEKYCVTSKRLHSAISTASRLKLGLSRPEVEKILGRPDKTTVDAMLYSRQFKRKSTPQEFEASRRDYPQNLTDAEAHRMFDYYPVDQYLVAKFANSKLVYLAIAVSGEGD